MQPMTSYNMAKSMPTANGLVMNENGICCSISHDLIASLIRKIVLFLGGQTNRHFTVSRGHAHITQVIES